MLGGLKGAGVNSSCLAKMKRKTDLTYAYVQALEEKTSD